MKQTIITALLLASAAVSVYGQTDTTKVKIKNPIYVYGTVADSFTKAGIPDLKAALLRPDSTVVDSIEVFDSRDGSYLGRVK